VTPKDKRTVFTERGLKLENPLFFQARNLAIEAMLLRLENRLLRQHFVAECLWSESSFRAPLIEIRLRNSGKGAWEYGKCTLIVNRDKIQAPVSLSPCYYSLASVETTEYWSGKQPKQLLDFRAAVAELAGSGYLAAEIEKLNYPFDYQPLSTF
jgi:hypothetical protein